MWIFVSIVMSLIFRSVVALSSHPLNSLSTAVKGSPWYSQLLWPSLTLASAMAPHCPQAVLRGKIWPLLTSPTKHAWTHRLRNTDILNFISPLSLPLARDSLMHDTYPSCFLHLVLTQLLGLLFRSPSWPSPPTPSRSGSSLALFQVSRDSPNVAVSHCILKNLFKNFYCGASLAARW